MAPAPQNPLLQTTALPAFSRISAEHVHPAVTAVIEQCRSTITAVTQQHGSDPTWDNVMSPIEEAQDRFAKVWSAITHLNMVCSTPDFRAEHDRCLPLVTEYQTFAGQHRPLWEALCRMAGSDEFALLTPAQRKAVSNGLRDFRLSGVELGASDRQRYLQISQRLAQLQSEFANNVLDATQGYVLHVPPHEEQRLSGLPPSLLAQTRAIASERGLDGHVLTLDMPVYQPALAYAADRSLRRELYMARITRASDRGPQAGQHDNTAHIRETLALRHELAQLLGFDNYAALSLEPKMAASTQEVMEFLGLLAERTRARGREEFAELEDFARSQGAEKLEPWDVSYYSERLRESRFAFNAEELRPYFPAERVISGLLECARRVFSVTFRPRLGVEVWNEDVTCWDVYDEFGARTGMFFMDLYAREGKRGGAWMDECRSRRYCADGTLQLPVAYVVCNFTPPRAGQPSQLTHDEVLTLFHEFGHALNLLLTRIDIAEVSGINGVPWDAVELPSQFNENFAWQAEVLSFLSGHVDSGAPLPADKLEALLAARNFHSAMAMLRQLEFAIFDFRIHLEYTPQAAPGFVREVLAEVRDQVSVVPHCEDDRFENSFSHIFAGGYAAGYYSYKWAEVLAADAFGRFEEEGIFSQPAGSDFRDYILASGGAQDPMQSFVAFRGRRPSIDALLVQHGIVERRGA